MRLIFQFFSSLADLPEKDGDKDMSLCTICGGIKFVTFQTINRSDIYRSYD